MEKIVIGDATILQGDCLEMLKQLADESVQCCVTSPPYWGLRDYGHEGQLGLEATPDEYTAKMVEVFREVRRVLKADGTLWLNLGDSYATQPGKGNNVPQTKWKANSYPESAAHRSQDFGLAPKNLIGIPWRVAFALQADGWFLRSEIIWYKPNAMPESVTDRPTKTHEHLFLLSKSDRYYYDHDAIKERDSGQIGSAANFRREGKEQVIPGQSHTNKRLEREATLATGWRNKRTVWEVPTVPFTGAHFAVFPPKLVEPCILAGARAGDTVLDPFNGSGTTGVVALKHGRRYIGIELNPAYVALTIPRLETEQQQLKLAL